MRGLVKTVLLFLVSSFTLFAGNITVKNIEPLTRLDQGAFFFPVVSPTGQIFFSGSNYSGLYMLDDNKEIKTISEKPGAGYEPAFSGDGNTVYFRPHVYSGIRRLSSLVKKSLVDGSEQVLIKKERDFTTPQRMQNGDIAINRDNKLYLAEENNDILKTAIHSHVVFIENGKIAVYTNNKKKILMPVGEGFYLWPSLSPDGTKLLFTKAGQGTYIADLNGNILVELGYANAPQWSPDGQWILFMRDIDDGHQIIDSDIYIISADAKTTMAITKTSDLKEIYPSWSAENEIVYCTDDGVIYKATLDNK